MYTSYKLKSHILDNKKEQLLIEHLENVANIATKISINHGIKEAEGIKVISTIAMCHDFGKASQYFQDYLKGKYDGNLKNHGEISAYLAYHLLPQKWKLVGFICVKRHHGNIDIDNRFFSCKKEEILKISDSIKINIKELKRIYGEEIESFFENIESGSLLKEVEELYIDRLRNVKSKDNKKILEEFIWIQYIWSLLLTADKTQLIRKTAFENYDLIEEKLTIKYKENIRKELKSKYENIEKSSIFSTREEVYNECIKSVQKLDINKDNILSINVPTGTGKTIAVYGAGFALYEKIKKEKNITPSIIYSVPFMSVIDQNYSVLKELLEFNKIDTNSNILLKHHSLSPIEYNEGESKEYKNYDARFLMENWQSTIITTTFVQLFNTVFKSGKNSIMHRFHKLAGSIIILDEVQAIPPEYYGIIEQIFSILCEKFGCYVISVTATKPLFLEGKELVSINQNIFSKMNRITIENHSLNDIYIDEFKEILLEDITKNSDKSFLVILNTVKSSLEVFQYLRDYLKDKREIIYLSTEILPIKRLDIINRIKTNPKKYILVSTQLIEAGVDIDFNIVYRDFAPLDSINQSAGRANRNGISEEGILKLYSISDENNKKYASYVYSGALLNATSRVLNGKEKIEESEMFIINQIYFEELSKVTLGKKNEETEKFMEYIKKLQMQNIRNEFELIKDENNKEDVIVRYNSEVEECINILEREHGYQEGINAWRKLNNYKIAVNKNKLETSYHEIKGMKFIDKDQYGEIGFIEQNEVQW